MDCQSGSPAERTRIGAIQSRTALLGRATLEHLRNGVHLVIAGASHGDDLFLGSPEIVPTILRFFRGDLTMRPSSAPTAGTST